MGEALFRLTRAEAPALASSWKAKKSVSAGLSMVRLV